MPKAPSSKKERSPYHVLLIGIDRYVSGTQLGGCVNDIDAVQKLLRERLHVPASRIKRLAAPIDETIVRPTEIPSVVPTRANMIAAFKYLANARRADPVQPGDRVFIYYSGHGAQRFASSGKDGVRTWREALVPTDNITKDEKERFLFDWELAALLARICKRTPAVTVVLDCCNSAGATRALPHTGTKKTTQLRKNPVARFLPPPVPAKKIEPPRDVAPLDDTSARGFLAGAAHAMVIAACLDTEIACESGETSERHGELTRAFLEHLESLPPATQLSELRWGQIWPSLVAYVEGLNQNQHPWLSSCPARRVFGGPPEDGDLGYEVTFDATTSKYRINAGVLMDVTKGAELALYDPIGVANSAKFLPLGSDGDLAERRGILRIIEAEQTTATAERIAGASPSRSHAMRGRLLKVGEAAKMAVGFSPQDPVMARALAASSLVRPARPDEKARLTLVRRTTDRAWAMTDGLFGNGEDGAAALTLLPANLASSPDTVRRWVEHYYRWNAPIRLAERCVDLPHCLKIRLLDGSQVKALPPRQFQDPPVNELHPEQRPAYNLKAGLYDPNSRKWMSTGESYCVRIENSSLNDNLWVTLVACVGEGTVSILGSRVFVGKQSRATLYFGSQLGVPFLPALFPPSTVGIDRLVAIGTTNEKATLDHLEVKETLAESLFGKRGAERALPPPPPAPELWTADAIVLRLQI
jgi:hypothetical protein